MKTGRGLDGSTVVSKSVWLGTVEGFDHRSVLEYLSVNPLGMYGNFMWKLPVLQEKYMYTHLMKNDVSRNGLPAY
jgi:hypothetical protein